MENICKGGNHPIEMRQCTLTVYEGEQWEWTRKENRTKIFYHCWDTKCHKQAKKQAKDYYQEIIKGLEIEVITQRSKK